MAQIHYLSGLSRSGNTLLSALLNQNPKIYSSPISPMADLLYSLEIECAINESFIRTPNHYGIGNVLKQLLNNYYSNINKEIIFDREKTWTTPNNLERIKRFINPNPKIIFTVRNTLDILASFVIQSKKHPFLENAMEREKYLPSYYLSKTDAICEYIMQSEYLMTKPLLGLYNGLKPENRKYVHFINYNNLINNSKETMMKLYLFLELEYFDHSFNNIKSLEVCNEAAVNLPQTLHEVHPTLKRYAPSVEEVLSKYIIDKYKNVDFWMDLI